LRVGPNAVARLSQGIRPALHFARSPGQGLLAECASFPREIRSGSGMEKTMSEITLFGFPRSVYVQMAGLVLTHKEVPYKFHDLEQEMGGPTHLALHPFDRVRSCGTAISRSTRPARSRLISTRRSTGRS